MSNIVPITKSEDEEPVPSAWREPLSQVVESFKRGDFTLRDRIEGVDSIQEADAAAIASNLKSYGDDLRTLPSEAWSTSICRWTGIDWEVLVDLFTVNEGLSDLVMFAKVIETDGDYLIKIDSVHVP